MIKIKGQLHFVSSNQTHVKRSVAFFIQFNLLLFLVSIYCFESTAKNSKVRQFGMISKFLQEDIQLSVNRRNVLHTNM